LNYSQAGISHILLGETAIPQRYNYEHGTRCPNIDVVRLISRRFGVPILWIYEGDWSQVGPALTDIIRRGEQVLNNPGTRPDSIKAIRLKESET
jgi:hypothetical protein